MAKGLTKTQLVRAMAEKLELTNKQTAAFLDLLAETAVKETKKNGEFTIPGIGNVTSLAGLVRPEIVVRPDFARAADLGVTSAAIADTLRVATMGDYDSQLPKLNLAERQVPIMVRLADSARQDLSLLGRLATVGDQVEVPGAVLTVERVQGRRIMRVRIEERERPSLDGDGAEERQKDAAT